MDRYEADECADIDLSSWNIAFNGAEPVSATTIRRFSETFKPHGFNSDAMFPCYGMAEATLFVSGGPRGQGAAFLKPDEANGGEGRREMVCSGAVHPEMSILIEPLDDCGHRTEQKPEQPSIGEICIAGPNVTSGYWRRDSDDLMFDAESGVRYLRTGDVGFLGEEGLYVTGRKKELIIVRGRNVYPYDIERTITGSDAGFQQGACAVFSVAKEEMGEEVVAVQEIVRTARHRFAYEEVAGVVRKNVIRDHDIRLNRLYFVVPGFIPRTTSGKIKRVALAKIAAVPNNRADGDCSDMLDQLTATDEELVRGLEIGCCQYVVCIVSGRADPEGITGIRGTGDRCQTRHHEPAPRVCTWRSHGLRGR